MAGCRAGGSGGSRTGVRLPEAEGGARLVLSVSEQPTRYSVSGLFFKSRKPTINNEKSKNKKNDDLVGQHRY